MKKTAKIKGNTLLSEIVNNKKFLKILTKYQVPCLTCPFAIFEIQNLTLKEVCETYNLDLKKLLKELNKSNK